jgi:hypothetical protein
MRLAGPVCGEDLAGCRVKGPPASRRCGLFRNATAVTSGPGEYATSGALIPRPMPGVQLLRTQVTASGKAARKSPRHG